MTYSIAEIANATGLNAVGDTSLRIDRPAEPANARAGDLALAMTNDYEAALTASAARAAVLWDGADWQALGLDAALYASRARVALAGLSEVFAHPIDLAPGIHPSAAIDPAAKLGEDVWVGPFAVIAAGALIGPGTRVMSQVSIGAKAEIGPNALLHPGTRIGARIRIGANFIAQPNACIGADGFSFVTPERGSVETAKETGQTGSDTRNLALRRINSLGSVQIGNDVEVGAGTTIDRGTVADTRIGSGSKIDNQVQIGHNAQIGDTCLICGQVGIAGSVVVGDRVVLGGQVGIADHLTIGADCVIAGGTLVGSSIRPGSVMIGIPAMPRDEFGRQLMALRRLPKMIDQVRDIKRKLGL